MEPVETVQFVLDNIFIFIAAVLVLFMQAGFALVEAGLTRAKNVGNIMMKNMSDMVVGVLAFYVIGYAIAFGADSAGLFGTTGFFLRGAEGVGNLQMSTFFMFQVAFVGAAATIASGAMAERTKFSAYLIFSLAMSAVIYPVVVHMFWGGGLIADLQIGDAKFGDFAGSTIVHSAGGWAALMGAIFLGPRIGKYDKDGNPRAIPGHSIPLAMTGVFILLIGWFGFNPGSELAADEYVTGIAVTTILAAMAGAVTSCATIWLKSGFPDVAMVGNGLLAGLVSITAGCGTMTNGGAIITGGIGGILVVFAVLFIDSKGIDDPVGAVSVHGVCGVWGTLAVGLFATYGDAFVDAAATDDNPYTPSGLLVGGNADQLIVQLLGVLIVAAWVIATTGLVFAAMKYTIGIRVSRQEEIEGLDIHEHGAPGYGPDVMASSSAQV
ncbi:MAG: ammonium transporter [Acidimicrobiales bacterium]